MMLAYAETGRRSVFFADRVKLVQQTADTLDKLGIDYSVMQADDPRYDPRKLIQIASIQTAVQRPNMDFSFAVVDEAHTVYKGFKEKYLDRYDNIPFVALSATPFSKGLGQIWDDLLIPITSEELTELGYLAPIDYYVGSSVDTSNIRTRRLPTGGLEFNPDDLGAAMMQDDELSGDIVENYLKHSPDGSKRAIAFCPTIDHSKTLVEKFNAHPSGIKARHIDGYTNDELRQALYADHKAGLFSVLSCSRLLGTGYDAPYVEMLIDAYPCRSKIDFVQRCGRIARISPETGKTRAIYLDHAGNIQRHGQLPDTIVPYQLDDGTKRYNEDRLIKQEEKQPVLRPCPVCTTQMSGRRCKACGYELPVDAEIYTSNEVLKKIERENMPTPEKFTTEDKERWYAELTAYAVLKGYRQGWAHYKFQEKFKVAPKGIERRCANSVSLEVRNWIKSRNIANAHRRAG
jgi:superfamily II DNA or RNA helicase